MYKLFTPKFAKTAHLMTDSPTAHPPGPKPARRSRPIRHLKPPVERVRSRKRYRELFRRYGIPNAIDVGYGLFCGQTGAAFIDDDDGRIVAYAPPWIASPRRRRSKPPGG
jgi:hypothetical protein